MDRTLILLLFAAAFAATPSDEARVLFLEGQEAYNRGSYLVAIEKFEAAYQKDARPLLLFNLAGAQERAGRWADARMSLQRYLDVCAPDEADAIRARVANLDVQIAMYGPEVVLSIGSLSIPDLPVGDGPPALAPFDGTVSAEAAAPVAQVEAPRRSWAAPIALGAVGVAGLGSSVAFGLLALDARADAADQCVSGVCTAGAEAALSRDRTWSTLTDVGFGVGAAGAIGAVVTAVVGRPTGLDIGPGWIGWHGALP